MSQTRFTNVLNVNSGSISDDCILRALSPSTAYSHPCVVLVLIGTPSRTRASITKSTGLPIASLRICASTSISQSPRDVSSQRTLHDVALGSVLNQSRRDRGSMLNTPRELIQKGHFNQLV